MLDRNQIRTPLSHRATSLGGSAAQTGNHDLLNERGATTTGIGAWHMHEISPEK
jgi:hypothetical protein